MFIIQIISILTSNISSIADFEFLISSIIKINKVYYDYVTNSNRILVNVIFVM